MFLLLVAFMLFTSTFTDFIIAGFETAEAGGNIANLLFTLCLIFCGVLANPDTLPRFWIFMYRISPFSYLVSAMLSTAVANTRVECADNEFLQFEPPGGMELRTVHGWRTPTSLAATSRTTVPQLPALIAASVAYQYLPRQRAV